MQSLLSIVTHTRILIDLITGLPSALTRALNCLTNKRESLTLAQAKCYRYDRLAVSYLLHLVDFISVSTVFTLLRSTNYSILMVTKLTRTLRSWPPVPIFLYSSYHAKQSAPSRGSSLETDIPTWGGDAGREALSTTSCQCQEEKSGCSPSLQVIGLELHLWIIINWEAVVKNFCEELV